MPVFLRNFGLLLLLPGASLAAQTICDSDGRTPAPQLGIGLLQCVAGNCGIFGGPPDAYEHRFTVEPRLRQIAKPGPAAGVLEEGDQLVAVDGAPITTRRGGRQLAQLVAGVPVQLTIRRDGAVREVRIVPAIGCGYPILMVTPTAQIPTDAAPAGGGDQSPAAPFELGVTLACDGCRWVRASGGAVMWQSQEVPRVLTIDPAGPAARSGLAVGDLVLTVDGRALVSESGGRYLGTIRPGQELTIEYSRDGRSATTHMTAGLRRHPRN